MSDNIICAAIFDVDELLVSLEPQHKLAERLLVSELGHDYDALPHELRTTSGRRVWDVVADMHAQLGWEQPLQEVYDWRQELFMQQLASAEIAPMPGARHAVTLLCDAGYPLAVCSSGTLQYIQTVLGRLDLLRFFTVIVSGENVTRGKPDPEPYLLAARRLGIPPARCVVFEDAAVGVRSAKAAGMICIGVPNPAALRRQDLSQADAILPSLEHLDLRLLQRLSERERL